MAIVAVDGAGVHTLDLAQAEVEMLTRFALIFGADIDIAAQTPQGQFAGLLAVLAVEIGEAVTSTANAVTVAHAVGAQLDALGSLLSVRRRPAAHSTATVTLTGTSGVAVAAGNLVRSTDGTEWSTATDVILDPRGVTVEVTATTIGAITAEATTINEIVTPVAGWETVTNPAAAAPGRAAETDSEYRTALASRSALAGVGPIAALEAAIADSVATEWAVVENEQATIRTVQQWPLLPHSITVLAIGGSAGDLTRAVETHRGMGCATTVAITGGAPNTTTLDKVTNGTIVWAGETFSGVDLTAANTLTAKAAALNAVLAGADTPVNVVAVDGRLVATFGWRPDMTPVFAVGDVATAAGLTTTVAAYPVGPFTRPRARRLQVAVTLSRGPGFPADGLTTMRQRIIDRVDRYRIGESVRVNDLLVAAESVTGARVSALTATHGGATADAAAVPIDGKWALAAADLEVTIN